MMEKGNRLTGRFDLKEFTSCSDCIKLLAIYEDQHARMEITQFCTDLEQSETDCRIASHAWEEKHPETLEQLVEAATIADVILVGGAVLSSLPPEITRALASGLANRRIAKGIVVAMQGHRNAQSKQTSAWIQDLRHILADGRCEFLITHYQLPQLPNCSPDNIRARADATSSTLTSILERHLPVYN